MKKILIRSSEASTIVESENVEVINFFKNSLLPHIFIPLYKVNDTFDDTNRFHFRLVDITKEGKSITFNLNKKECIIYDDWSKGVPTYILSFLQLHLSTLLAEKSIITLHSSSVQDNANFVFLGHAGAGKTTVMLDLMSKLNYKYISNNKTLVHIQPKKVMVIGGTSLVSIRDRFVPAKLKPKIMNVNTTLYGRISFMFKDNYIGLLADSRKTFYIFLQINSGVSEFREIEDKNEVFVRFYPFFLDVVDHEVALFDYSKPVPTQLQTSDQLKEKILLLMNEFVSNNTIYHLSGSLDFVREKVDYLNKLV